jgi:hypothetical protein
MEQPIPALGGPRMAGITCPIRQGRGASFESTLAERRGCPTDLRLLIRWRPQLHERIGLAGEFYRLPTFHPQVQQEKGSAV